MINEEELKEELGAILELLEEFCLENQIGRASVFAVVDDKICSYAFCPGTRLETSRSRER